VHQLVFYTPSYMTSSAEHRYAIAVKPMDDSREVDLGQGQRLRFPFTAQIRALGDSHEIRLVVAATGEPPRPEVRAIVVGSSDDEVPVTTTLLRSIKVEQLLADAVQAAVFSSEDGVSAHWGIGPSDKSGSVRLRRGRVSHSDDTVRNFVKDYRALSGTMAERAAHLGWSRTSIYRLRDEARERGIIGKDEDL
jgi:hypothetical protein